VALLRELYNYEGGGATRGAATANPSGAPEITPRF